MTDRGKLEAIFREHGCTDFKWIDTRHIVVAQWVRVKCMYGCLGYGSTTCPPNTPLVEDCRHFISEYHEGVVFHFVKPDNLPPGRRDWGRDLNARLMELERAVFLSGCHKAFLTAASTCWLCPECTAVRVEGHDQKVARPTPEGLAIDVFATVRRYDYPIDVPNDETQDMNRYAFLLIE